MSSPHFGSPPNATPGSATAHRSILRRATDRKTVGGRLSVSFAKRKEVVTFTGDDSGESSVPNSPAPANTAAAVPPPPVAPAGRRPSISHVPLSPLSDESMRSSRLVSPKPEQASPWAALPAIDDIAAASGLIRNSRVSIGSGYSSPGATLLDFDSNNLFEAPSNSPSPNILIGRSTRQQTPPRRLTSPHGFSLFNDQQPSSSSSSSNHTGDDEPKAPVQYQSPATLRDCSKENQNPAHPLVPRLPETPTQTVEEPFSTAREEDEQEEGEIAQPPGRVITPRVIQNPPKVPLLNTANLGVAAGIPAEPLSVIITPRGVQRRTIGPFTVGKDGVIDPLGKFTPRFDVSERQSPKQSANSPAQRVSLYPVLEAEELLPSNSPFGQTSIVNSAQRSESASRLPPEMPNFLRTPSQCAPEDIPRWTSDDDDEGEDFPTPTPARSNSHVNKSPYPYLSINRLSNNIVSPQYNHPAPPENSSSYLDSASRLLVDQGIDLEFLQRIKGKPSVTNTSGGSNPSAKRQSLRSRSRLSEKSSHEKKGNKCFREAVGSSLRRSLAAGASRPSYIPPPTPSDMGGSGRPSDIGSSGHPSNIGGSGRASDVQRSERLIRQTEMSDCEEGELQQSINERALPDLGLAWNEYQAPNLPDLEDIKFMDPYPNFEECVCEAERKSGGHLTDQPLVYNGIRIGSLRNFSRQQLGQGLKELFNRLGKVQVVKKNTGRRVSLLPVHPKHVHDKTNDSTTDSYIPLLSLSSLHPSLSALWLLVESKLPHTLDLIDNVKSVEEFCNLFDRKWQLENQIEDLVCEIQEWFTTDVTRQVWENIGFEIAHKWAEEYRQISQNITHIPTTPLARVLLLWTIGASNGNPTDVKLCQLFAANFDGVSRAIKELANLDWKLSTALPAEFECSEQIDNLANWLHDKARGIESVVQELLREALRLREEAENSDNPEAVSAKSVALEHLRATAEIDKEALKREQEKLEDLRKYTAEAESELQTEEEQTALLHRKIAKVKSARLSQEGFIRAVATLADSHYAMSWIRGTRFGQNDVDWIEIHNEHKHRLIPNNCDSLQTISEYFETDSNDSFESWEMRRKDFLRELLIHERESDIDFASKRENFVTGYLAVPPRVVIRVIWRLNISAELLGLNSGSPILADCLAVEMDTMLEDEPLSYLPPPVRWAVYEQHPDPRPIEWEDLLDSDVEDEEIEEVEARTIITRRVPSALATHIELFDGYAPIIFDWEMRHLLHATASETLSDLFLHRCQRKGLLKRSTADSIVDDDDPESIAESLAPGIPKDEIVECVKASITVVRHLADLMEQQRQLVSQFIPCKDFGTHMGFVNESRSNKAHGEVEFNVVVYNRTPSSDLGGLQIVIRCNLGLAILLGNWTLAAISHRSGVQALGVIKPTDQTSARLTFLNEVFSGAIRRQESSLVHVVRAVVEASDFNWPLL